MAMSKCCFRGFQWEGTPMGRVGRLANNDTYIAGNNPNIVILFIADMFGWDFINNRLLADHFAREIRATVYVPDFFGGEVVASHIIAEEEAWEKMDLKGALPQEYKKVGAVGYCYGGWAVFRLGAKEHSPSPLVDCISLGHPSLLTKQDIDEIAVPVQVLAPEIDPVYTAELKQHTWETIPWLGVPFDYQ
ncbi:hypothetical protein TMatcc_008111 [Talaromyces marneffei ATCC 18224]|uniref:uncharacterized protein n=1 Tax=Talaromyces marneffei TaxID=37727 RepID=UPI0012A8AF06|nr:uncharacterized protein EYB26_005004 [Talaromyces marneffei]KAE8552528.1 hypothetical protein EYB25_003906 [Talaromyces marneffei]QGA17333.1 hypothetical protein EYB26_005004 [Talaromyces marneffei]